MRSLCAITKLFAVVLSIGLPVTLVPAASAATLTVTTKSLPNGVDGAVYSAQLASANGTGAVTWVLAPGSSLVKGLTLTTSGKISGTASASTNGAGNFKVVATDSAKPAHTATAIIAYVINPENGNFRITTTQFPNATVGVPYSTAIHSSAAATDTVTYKLINSTSLPAGLKLSSAGAITGTPTAATGTGFVVQATDSSTPTAKTVIAYLNILVNLAHIQIAPNLPSGSVGVAYGGTIDVVLSAVATFNYSWTVNGVALPTNGTQLALGDGLNIFACSGPHIVNLCIGGTPTSAGTVSFKLAVTDPAGATGGPFSLSITITPPAIGQVSGQINPAACGGNLPTFTVKINTTPVKSTTTDSNGNFSFEGVPNGSYTVTPSIAGPSSVFFPKSKPVTLSNDSVSNVNFQVEVGYTVSGTVDYSGTKTGRIYLVLNGGNCGSQAGTSVAVKGAFTIRGVGPGSYTLQAWMDNVGYGAPNVSNPSGSTSGVNITTASLSGVSVTLADPAPISLTSAPQLQGVAGLNEGAFAAFNGIANNNGVELATSYKLEWSTLKTFTSVTGSKTLPATGTKSSGIWFVNGLASGAVYYFRAQGMAGSSVSPWSNVVGPVTIEAPTGGNAVSGTVSFAGVATGPLYTGFYSQKTGKIYVTAVGSEASPPTSPVAYSVQVPSGSGYVHIGIVDQKNAGTVVPGDIENVTHSGRSSGLTISGPLINDDLTLPGGNSSVALTTEHYHETTQDSFGQGYDLNFSVNGEVKLPAAVALVSGPNALVPMDIGQCNNCGNGFGFYFGLGPATPSVGDTYGLQVTYTDGTSEILGAKVSGVPNAFATNLVPTGTGGSTTPTFTWTDPANAGSYVYQFSLRDPNNNEIWRIPGHDSGPGFASTITSITFGADPTGATNPPSVTSLTTGETYQWQIQVQDSNGNSTQQQVFYQP